MFYYSVYIYLLINHFYQTQKDPVDKSKTILTCHLMYRIHLFDRLRIYFMICKLKTLTKKAQSFTKMCSKM